LNDTERAVLVELLTDEIEGARYPLLLPRLAATCRDNSPHFRKPHGSMSVMEPRLSGQRR